jgi:hypothetical protein
VLVSRAISLASAAQSFISYEDGVSKTVPYTIANACFIFVKVSLPIVEWAGSGAQFVW